MLPTGRLREPLLLLNARMPLSYPIRKRSRRSQKRLACTPSHRTPCGSGKNIAFSGIARPRQFFDGLKAAKQEIAGTLTFRDHHRYAQRDIDRLLLSRKQTGAAGFITTEKDAINLGALSAQLHRSGLPRSALNSNRLQHMVAEMLRDHRTAFRPADLGSGMRKSCSSCKSL